uniref:NADH-ubiquinone oxidoreductase chain 4L n=1 Tax=Argulus japonicus TaxID=873553 RepID=A0A7I8F090_9CRUS|nr:NADH dehydrogenase subunit 4L [Argulus japonicus]
MFYWAIFNVLMVLFMMVLGSFCLKRRHLLINLLSLEFGMLLLFLLLQLSLSLMESDVYLGLYFLLLGVCEGVLGLGLVVGLSRCHGSDYFSIKNFLMC